MQIYDRRLIVITDTIELYPREMYEKGMGVMGVAAANTGESDVRGVPLLAPTERDVIIDGNVQVSGGNVRIRGFTITGDVVVNGNTFGMAYSVVRGSTDIRGNAVAFLRNSFCGTVRVPSSSASLLDNRGMAPLNDVTEVECP